jgi:hypothetical protein
MARRARPAASLLVVASVAASVLGGVATLPRAGYARPGADRPPWADEAEALLEGVAEIAAPGALPGTIAVFGPDAFPLLLGGAGGKLRVPIAGAATLGKGRVVALAAHARLSGPASAKVADTGRFLANAVRFVAGAARAPRVGVTATDVAPVLVARGFAAVDVPAAALAGRLDALDVVVLGEGSPPDALREALDAFVRRGGGLVTGLCPWGWKQVTGAPDLSSNGLQRLLAPAGLAFTDATAETTGAKGYVVAGPPGLAFHAARAVDLLAATAGAKAKGLDLALASRVAQEAVAVLPAGEKKLRARVRALARERAAHLVPTAREPLDADRPLDRFLLAVTVADLADAAPADVEAHPAAAAFPGAPSPGTRATSRTVALDLAVPGWHSTGLYAAPGKPVTVRAPVTTDEGAAGLAVRIGAHADALWHLPSWPRVPAITLETPLSGARTTVASAFGGLVYLVVPSGRTGLASVTAAARAGTCPTRRRRLRGGARWPGAELATSKVVLTVPSEAVRDLDDPAPLLRFWDRVLDADADLAGSPRTRARPERIVADVEISAGYMHSGYPIMVHLDAAPRMVDVGLLATKGDWGLFHELGHNHQAPEWTFEGTGEVTCNLFALYVLQTVVGLRAVGGHEALAEREAKAAAHVAAGAPFAAWKGDPFLALAMYVHLIEGFGWTPFREVFAAYRALPDAERPKDDAARRDAWMVRFARAVGRDLGPFFVAWGVPTSDAARASIRDLPAWMPPGFPPRAGK